MENIYLEEAIEQYESVTKFAHAVGVKNQAVIQQWRKHGVPAKYCKTIEFLTGVTAKSLRPDDWQFYWPEMKKKRKTK